MSIPIAARQYIAEMGFSGINWTSQRYRDKCVSKRAIVVHAERSNRFDIDVAYLSDGDVWVYPSNNGWSVPIRGVVCWSEIKL